jgi:Tfp pilus assembly protein PilO
VATADGRQRRPWPTGPLLLVGGAIGLASFLTLHRHAFQSAALGLEMPRAEAIGRTRALLAERGYDVRGYEGSVVFWTDRSSFIFLEKTAGTTEANRLIRERGLPVWGWDVRLFRPHEKEEFRVRWTPAGNLVSLAHERYYTPRSGPAVSREDAREQARAALRLLVPSGVADYELVAESTLVAQWAEESRAPRDFSFTWRQRSDIHGAHLVLRATVTDDEVRRIAHELEVPESFDRQERAIHSRRWLVQELAWLIDWLSAPAVLVFLLMAWRRRWVRWGPAVRLAGVLTVFRMLAEVNDFPLAWHGYPTQSDPSAFWLTAVVKPILGHLFEALWLVALFAAADAAGRLVLAGDHSLGELARPRFYVSRAGLRATLAGLATAALSLGYVTLFYLVGRRFLGLYSPEEIPYDNLLSTTLPWTGPLLTGLGAALEEESTYRLFVIALLLHWTPRRWLAVLLPAVLWGFLHTLYYVEPIYARGLELSVAGLYYGAVYLRYGIWATVVSHYVYNATVSSPFFLENASPRALLSSAAVIAVPLVPLLAAAAWRASGRLLVEIFVQRIQWGPHRPPAPAFEERRARRDPALDLQRAAALLCVAVVALLLLPADPRAPSMDVDRARAIEITREHLAGLGHAVGELRATTSFERTTVSAATVGYVKQHGGTGGPAFLEQRRQPELEWQVVLFVPGRPDTCHAAVGRGGTVDSFRCTIDPEAPGVTLEAAASRELAEAYLRRRGIAAVRYAGATENARSRRKDVTHRWTEPAAGLNDLQRWIAIDVVDGRIAGFRRYDVIPDWFIRERSSQTVPSVSWDLAGVVFGLAAVALLVRAIFDRAVVARLWEPVAGGAALVVFVFELLSRLNTVPSLWTEYDPTTSAEVYLVHAGVSWLKDAFGVAAFAYAAVILFLRITPQVFPTSPTAKDVRETFTTPPWRWFGGRAALVWAAATVTLFAVAERLARTLGGEASSPVEYDAFARAVPSAPALLELPWNLIGLAAAVAALAIARRYLVPRRLLSRMARALRRIGAAAARGLRSAVPTLWAAGRLVVRPFRWLAAVRPRHVIPVLLLVLAFAVKDADVFKAAVGTAAALAVRFHLPFYVWAMFLEGSRRMLPWLANGPGVFRFHALVLLFMAAALAGRVFWGFKRRAAAPIPEAASARARPQRRLWAAAVALTVVMVGVQQWLLFVSERDATQQDLQQRRERLRMLEAIAQDLAKFEADEAQLDTKLRTLRTVLPLGPELKELDVRLRVLAESIGVVLRDVRHEAHSRDFYSEIDTTLTVFSPPFGIEAFLDKVGRMPRLATLTATRPTDRGLEVTLTAYAMPSSAAAPAPADACPAASGRVWVPTLKATLQRLESEAAAICTRHRQFDALDAHVRALEVKRAEYRQRVDFIERMRTSGRPVIAFHEARRWVPDDLTPDDLPRLCAGAKALLTDIECRAAARGSGETTVGVRGNASALARVQSWLAGMEQAPRAVVMRRLELTGRPRGGLTVEATVTLPHGPVVDWKLDGWLPAGTTPWQPQPRAWAEAFLKRRSAFEAKNAAARAARQSVVRAAEFLARLAEVGARVLWTEARLDDAFLVRGLAFDPSRAEPSPVAEVKTALAVDLLASGEKLQVMRDTTQRRGLCQRFELAGQPRPSDGFPQLVLTGEPLFAPYGNPAEESGPPVVFAASSDEDMLCRPDRDDSPRPLPRAQETAGRGALTIRLRDVDLVDAFRVIHDLTGEGFVIDGDVTGRVQLDLERVGVEQAIAALEGGGVQVSPPGRLRRVWLGLPANPKASSSRRHEGGNVSFDFKRAYLSDVLRLFVDITGLEVLAPDADLGRVSVFAVDVPWDAVFLEVLRAADLAYSIERRRLFVAPPEAILRRKRDRRLEAEHDFAPPPLRVAWSYEPTEGLQLEELHLAGLAASGPQWTAYAYDPRGHLRTLRAGQRLHDASVSSVGPDGLVVATKRGSQRLALPAAADVN